MPIDALSVLCAQLTRDLLAIAKFLFIETMFLYVKPFMRCSASKNGETLKLKAGVIQDH